MNGPTSSIDRPWRMRWPRCARTNIGVLALACVALAGCGREQPAQPASGQALASVNGEEITVLQLNEEMQRAGVPAARQEAAGKQLLQVLIDRTLLEEAAAQEKLDRDPKVMQAIERARALIVAQAYMQKRVGDAGRPSQAEIRDYFDKHPQFFAERKQFTMNQLIMPAAALSPELRAAADKAGSLEEVAVMLEARKIGFGRARVTRSTADLNPQLAARLLSVPKGQMFFAREGERALLVAVADVVDAPVALDIAAPQIAQFLANRKNRELAQAELARLRGTASIDYLNKKMAPDGAGQAGAGQASPVLARAPLAAAGKTAPAAAPVDGAGAASGAAPAVAEPRSVAAPASSPVMAGGAAGSGNADRGAVERGVAGLE